MESFALPSIEEVIDLTIRLGSRTNPAIRCGGVSLNTSSMGVGEAEALIGAEGRRLHLPVADPLRRDAHFPALVANSLAWGCARGAAGPYGSSASFFPSSRGVPTSMPRASAPRTL